RSSPAVTTRAISSAGSTTAATRSTRCRRATPAGRKRCCGRGRRAKCRLRLGVQKELEQPMNPDWRARYETAVEAAAKAGRLALNYFQTRVDVEWKQDLSPVTAADREAEQLLRTTLLGRFPQDGFLGEESGDTSGTSGYRWIIDPVDGTRSFVRGIPLWATLV